MFSGTGPPVRGTHNNKAQKQKVMKDELPQNIAVIMTS